VLARYAGSFRHVARVPNAQLRDWYARSSAFVLPSIEDGFGVVAGEALACGLPVVTTENSGAAEVLDDGADGFVVPIRSPTAIAERLELLHRDAALRERMSDAARAKAATLSWERYAERLCGLYDRLAQIPRQLPGR
jgi:glycosyltransferase involved in cell wall biosynthesis